MIRIGNLDILIQLDIACCNDARTLLAECELGIVTAAHLHGDALEIQQNLNHVFLDTFDGTVLVQNTIDLHFCYGATRHRRQENTAQRTAQSVAEAALQGLKRYLGTRGTGFLYVNGTRCQ